MMLKYVFLLEILRESLAGIAENPHDGQKSQQYILYIQIFNYSNVLILHCLNIDLPPPRAPPALATPY